MHKVFIHSSSFCTRSSTYIFLLLLFSKAPSVSAQSRTIDSLDVALSTTASDSIRLMDELIKELINVDIDQAETLAQDALDLSLTKKDKEAEATALHNMGLVLYESKERSSSLQYFEKSEHLADELELRKLQTLTLMRIANFHRYVNHDSTKAVQHLHKSVKVSTAADYHWGAGRSYAKLASFYTRYNKIDSIEKFMELAAENYLNAEDADVTIAHYYNEVGDKIWAANPTKSMDFYFKGMKYAETPNLMVSLAKAYSYTGENEIALSYLNKAIPLYRSMNDQKRKLGIALSRIAEAYIELDDYTEANNASDEGIELLSSLGRSSQKAMPSLFRSKGTIEEYNGNSEKALEYYNKSLNEAIRIKYGYEKIKANLTLGLYYSSIDLQQAKSFCKRSFKSAQSKKHPNLEIQACECLYKIYYKEKSYGEALNYFKQKTLLNDSLSTTNIEYAFTINSKLAEKDKLIEEQSSQKKLREEELRIQYKLNRSLALSSILGLLLIGFLAMGYFRIRKQNAEINNKTEELLNANLSLERSNQELERFAHITSHDLKTPIRSILSFSGLLRSKIKPEENSSINNYLTFIENSGKRMKQLIEDILEFSQLSGNSALKKETIDLNRLANELSNLAKTASSTENMTIEVTDLPEISWYYSKMFLLFKNIIENGIKYNNSYNPTVKVYGERSADYYKIFIEDNGIGIEKEYFDQIFIMFKRLHNQEQFEGTGLGLATCKKIVEEFEGTLSIESEVNRGTRFTIEIPNELIIHSAKTKTTNASVLVS